MKNFSCYTSRTGNVLSQQLQLLWRYAMVVLAVFLMMSNSVHAQTVRSVFNLPAPERCTSNDLDVVDADLVLDNCDCTEGETVYGTLTLGVRNNTESLRTSFAFWARLVMTDDDPLTNDIVYYITGCEATILPGSQLPNRTKLATFEDLQIFTYNSQTGQLVPFNGGSNYIPGTIPYVCGTELNLTNIYQAWTDAATNDGRQCPLDPSKINPKCGIIPLLEVGVGLSAESTSTNVTCNGAANGSITLTFSGGTGPYYLNFNDGGYSSTPITSPYTVSNLSGSTTGTVYTWKIKDSSDPFCERTGSETIFEPVALSATETHVNVLCYGGATGSIDLSPSGGTAPYTYAWTASNGGVIPTGQEDDQDLSGLVAGTYSVVITDANGTTGGCRATKEVTITQPAAALSATETHVNVLCYGGATGSIDLSPSGGTAP
ncbi:hypothetical protein ABID22_001962, partial [Pontibacter aydingkolensis]